MTYEQELAVAKALAEQAGQTALEFQRRGIEAEQKPDESPVTAADRVCEKLIVEGLASAFPNDGVLGEEGASRGGSSGRRWIIDPIDGTKDFVRGIPLWAILIGLEDQGRVVAGVAYCPGQRMLLWASQGNGAWCEAGKLRVTDQSSPAQAVLSFNGFNKAGVISFAPRLLDWVGKFWAVRSMGGAVDAMLLATGHTDIWIEPNAQPWDLAALKILVEEAGGVFGAFDGSDSIYGGNAWACVPGLHACVKQLLAS
jgi:histidinol-phosphatase